MSARKEPLRGYFAQTRDLLNSLVLVVPLLVLYQAGLLLTGGRGLNAVDFVSIPVHARWGSTGILVLNLVLMVACAIAIGRLARERRLAPGVFFPMVVESALYALFFGAAIRAVLQRLPFLGSALHELTVLERVVVSLGAGVNEEVFFRLLLFSGLLAAAKRAKLAGDTGAWIAAASVSALVFALAHHVPGGEPFLLHSFAYRTVAGLLLTAIFSGRGFAVAVYTHVFYDLFVLVLLPAAG